MRMTGYEAFILHHAVNLHFNRSYDCWKYNFKTNVTEKTYWKRPDKFQLTKIGKRFKTRDDIILYFASHQIAGNKYTGDMIRDEDTYTKFLKRIDSISYLFKNELEEISDVKFDKLLEIKDTYPRIIQLHLEGTVSLETVCIVNRLTGFIEKANSRISETILWPDLYNKISKYQSFLKFDDSKMRKIILDVFK
jgi:hypothetical protein|tara:strand:- start:13921 stop:14499 length:579 start_codon:yes stop_codon:yes gene_type:complete